MTGSASADQFVTHAEFIVVDAGGRETSVGEYHTRGYWDHRKRAFAHYFRGGVQPGVAVKIKVSKEFAFVFNNKNKYK